MKIAMVTPRYGAEISEGAEHACRLLAEQLSNRHDVEVLTTCARNKRAWKNEYAEGADRVRGVLVRRFTVPAARDAQPAKDIEQRLFTSSHSRADELEWIRRVGPSSQGLVEFLRRHHRNYDVIVFFSWRHPLSVHGLSIAPERSILVPWLRMEPATRLAICNETLGAPVALAYCSGAERILARLYTRIVPPHEEFVGIGIEPPPQQTYPRLQQQQPDPDDHSGDSAADIDADAPAWYLSGRGTPFRRRHRLHGRFVLLGGRVEPDNGSEEIIEYFSTFAAQDGDTSLVLMGVKMMKLPEEPYLKLAGVLPDRERMTAFEAADVTLMPEPDDLLAAPVLESFAVGTPVVACGRNLAAVDHCRRANGGLYYANRDEFVEALNLLTTNDRLREKLGRNGRHYVRQHYRWEAVIGRFERLAQKLKRN
jgi:glycosyltransferase involved in cell wall biosynthesis